MSVMAEPQKRAAAAQRAARTGMNRWVVAGVAALVALLAIAAVGMLAGGAEGSPAGQFQLVAPMALDIRIVKDGELQAIDNIDINSEVEGSNTIQTLVKEGTWVKKGDVLVTLDSSEIKQRIEDVTLDVQRAEAEATNARENKEIQESQNAANLEAAQVGLMVAKLDLQQYEEGTHPQAVANAETELAMNRITLKNREEDLAQTRALFEKAFVTAADVKKAELDVTVAGNNVRKSETALHVLKTYTHEMDLASRKNNLAQAEQRLARVRRESASSMAWRSADLRSKEQQLLVQKRRLERYKEQLAKCTITAPADGLVVYASSVDRHRQNPVQEGAQVRERELIIRLPDVSAMQAVVRIQESQVPKLQVGQRAKVKIVGLPEPVEATLDKISVLADNSQRWWNPDLKEYPVDLVLDHTPADLKPGAGCQAEIMIERLENVLAVPLAAIYSAGEHRYVFVRDGSAGLEGVKPFKVTVGASNETHVQVTEGLAAGREVLLLQAGQGRDLLEKAGIKIQPTTRPGGEKNGRDQNKDNGNGSDAKPPAVTAAK